MAANTSPIFPVSPFMAVASLTGIGAITSRANISGTAGLTALGGATTNGRRIDSVTVKAKSNTVSGIVSLWLSDGTTAYLFDEFDVASTSTGTNSDSAVVKHLYTDLVLQPGWRLYTSLTVTNDVNVIALGGEY